jgi:hypothetical protein
MTNQIVVNSDLQIRRHHFFKKKICIHVVNSDLQIFADIIFF